MGWSNSAISHLLGNVAAPFLALGVPLGNNFGLQPPQQTGAVFAVAEFRKIDR
ncbi:MAG: hypothetical protein Pars93KO_24680 [Parasphingorhabdus sp.]